jgi:predicted  nucleic acid-binding Zn-ribbon protein
VGEIKAAVEKEAPKEESLGDLEEEFKKLREDRRKAKNENEMESLDKDIDVVKEKIGRFYLRRIKALLDGLAPIFRLE